MLILQSSRVAGILKDLHSFVSLLLRHLRMINKELDKIEDTLGRRNTLQLEEEDRLHWHNVQTKLNQHKQIEEVRSNFKWETCMVLFSVNYLNRFTLSFEVEFRKETQARRIHWERHFRCKPGDLSSSPRMYVKL